MTRLPTAPSSGRADHERTKAPSSLRKLSLAWSATDDGTAMNTPMLKIAFATSDRVVVDQHFGAAVGFAIYAVNGASAHLVEATEYPLESMDGNEDKLATRIAGLAGCAAVYCLAVGGSAVRQLLAGGVQPVRVEAETSIETLLNTVRKAVREGGVAWIDKHLRHERHDDTRRFDRMAEEGWQE